MLNTILLVAGLICLAAASIGVTTRVNLGWLGLFLIFLRGIA